MTSLLDSPHLGLLDALRGDPRQRPARDVSLAGGLRAQLEDELFVIFGDAVVENPVRLRPSLFRPAPPDPAAVAPTGRVRGVLVSYLLRLLSVGASIDAPLDSALAAWRCDWPADQLLAYVECLDGDERASLTSSLDAHAATLARVVGPVGGRWLPRTHVGAHQRLAGGHVELRDVVDLMVGSTASPSASVVLVDVTTSALDEHFETVIRYHALVQTLRTSTVPLRTSVFSTATGELWSRDVSDDLLRVALGELVDLVRREVGR